MTVISATLALEALRTECTDLTDLLDKARAKRAHRDFLIKDAIEAGMTYKSVQKVTGLSRDHIRDIVNKPTGTHIRTYV
jgi:Mor family transcriptional regulator